MAHDRPHSYVANSPTMPSQTPFPLDAATSPSSSFKQRRASRDLPSRSFYASAIPGETSTEAHYSASTDSIRAHSLALKQADVNPSLRTHPSHHDSTYFARSANVSSNSNSNSTSNHHLVSPPSTAPSSNLSYLLQNKNYPPPPPPLPPVSSSPPPAPLASAPAQLPLHDETRPLLEQTDTLSTQYHSIESNHASPPAHLHYSYHPHYTAYHPATLSHDYTTDADHSPLSTPKKPSLCFFPLAQNPLRCIPAVILGLLLNLLDAISYGLITFPLNNPIFASFGPDGISMFFVSCIVSQLVYSCGGSVFAGGNGSMMIEVVPFLHSIAQQIVNSVGSDQPDAVIASTVVAFALSSILTGIAFFLLGALNLGSLIGFFPRHILVGTIGGVGWFLITTGIEVSGRLDENLAYTLPMLRKIFLDTQILSRWLTALAAALLLRALQARVKSPLLVPAFFMVLPLTFYLLVFICRLDISHVRDAGWIFPLVESDQPFWHFYTYYDFTQVDWAAVVKTLPAMLALTFFGVLHVPINVPALGVSTNKDDVDVNRELVAHGISNALSGLLGSVQNYLVYTNSLLFIRTGGDSRVAGIMLAAATAALWMVGPWIVGYIPVLVVGSLIFHLGIDLLKEALVDTWHSVHYLEYITICAIITCMATLGFVEGILVGIVMACVFFVMQNARRGEVIRVMHTGQEMRSTVRRPYRQLKFLKHVGSQTQVIKLQGFLFFGTINQVERAIRDLLDERAWNLSPIRFLLLDLQLVQGLDFSAAEAFVRIRRLLQTREVYMGLCNAAPHSDVSKALRKAGMWIEKDDDVSDLQCFEFLNDALEWCENMLLQSYYAETPQPSSRVPSPIKADRHRQDVAGCIASPRHRMLDKAIQELTPLEAPSHALTQSSTNLSQPMCVLMNAFSDLNTQVPVDFYHKLAQYFERATYTRGQAIWREGEPCEFLIVLEQGALRSVMDLGREKQALIENILPSTIVGELGLLTASQHRTRSLVAEEDSVIWKLTRSAFEEMLQADPAMANEFMLSTLHFSSERLDIMTRYAFQLH